MTTGEPTHGIVHTRACRERIEKAMIDAGEDHRLQAAVDRQLRHHLQEPAAEQQIQPRAEQPAEEERRDAGDGDGNGGSGNGGSGGSGGAGSSGNTTQCRDASRVDPGDGPVRLAPGRSSLPASSSSSPRLGECLEKKIFDYMPMMAVRGMPPMILLCR